MIALALRRFGFGFSSLLRSAASDFPTLTSFLNWPVLLRLTYRRSPLCGSMLVRLLVFRDRLVGIDFSFCSYSHSKRFLAVAEVVDMKQFEEILRLNFWAQVENRFRV